MKKITLLFGISLLLASSCATTPTTPATKDGHLERIQSFCIDFNWSGKGWGGFSMPSDFSSADPKVHYDWYVANGVNAIQSFCVSHNGYAWYDSKVAPKVPGLKSNFLKELVELGHKDGRLVMGYFSPAANNYWREQNPEECYHDNTMFHVVYTKKYLDYLGASIRDAVQSTGIDGFMLDAIFAAPGYADRRVKWLECEKEMYVELIGEEFPGVEAITPEMEEEFLRRSLTRCWDTIYNAAKGVDPNIIIWVTAHDILTPQMQGTTLLKEVDWLMNESADPEKIRAIRAAVGSQTRLIQCVVGWGEEHNASSLFEQEGFEDMGFYGFAWPDSLTTLPYTLESAGDNSRYVGNAKNIEAMRQFYHTAVGVQNGEE